MKVGALFAAVLVAAVAAGFLYLLSDPGAPLGSGGGAAVTAARGAERKVNSAPVATSDTTAGGSAKVDAILESVTALQGKHEAAQAEAVLKAAIGEHATDQRLYVAYAELLLGGQRYGEAYENYVRALATGERSATLEFQAGTVASLIGRNDRAIEHYSAAQTADPKNAEYALFLGQVQLQSGMLDEARASIVRAAQLNPDDPRAWGTLAEIALRENKLDVAMEQIQKARAMEPRATVWRLIEAKVHARQGRPERAVELLVALDPVEKQSEAIARVLADSLSMLKRDAEAAEVLGAASDAAPKQANLAFDAAVRAAKAKDAKLFARLRERAASLGVAGASDLKMD